MDFNPAIDGVDALITSMGRVMAEAMQRAASTGETVDFLRAQQVMSEFTNLTSFRSSVVKMLHDLIAGIIQKI